LTINPAKILGIDDRTGTLEVGKQANFIVTEGDLFDIRSGKVSQIYLDGQLIDPENRQTDLYLKYLRKHGLPEMEGKP
jgi:imidazolonepropionase-like amidohydrolase